jgi:poly(A) polymerase
MAASPGSPLADPAVQRLFTLLPDARLVGGCVRDALAGKPGTDVDLATPQPPERVAAALAAAKIRAIPTGIAHGTVTALIDGRPFEITTLRRDVLTDGRHAEVSWTDDWREDAARRDFTINAMSLSRDGTLHDYFGGAADLRAGRVRFVGDAARRVAEDYLRILRFFRFQARYGVGQPDADALAAIRAGVSGIERLSAERVWSELKRILQAPDPTASVQLMAQTGVLAAAVPEGAAATGLAHLPPDPLLRTAAILTGDRAAFAARLKLSLAETARLVALQGPPPRFVAEGDDADLRRQLAETEPEILIGRSLLARQEEAVRDRILAIPPPVFPLEGRDALAIGVPPGPAVGALLRKVRAWWLAGGCVADATVCRAELARLACD